MISLLRLPPYYNTAKIFMKNNPKYRPGNHQTRGMSALAMLSILFRDFNGPDLWYQRSISILEEHLSKEVNPDGFQFERSVHYHMGDIENYFMYINSHKSVTPRVKCGKTNYNHFLRHLPKLLIPTNRALHCRIAPTELGREFRRYF